MLGICSEFAEIRGDVVADLAGRERHDPTVRLADFVRLGDLQLAVADDACDVELSARVQRHVGRPVARVRTSTDRERAGAPRVGRNRADRAVADDLQRRAARDP